MKFSELSHCLRNDFVILYSQDSVTQLAGRAPSGIRSLGSTEVSIFSFRPLIVASLTEISFMTKPNIHHLSVSIIRYRSTVFSNLWKWS